MSVDIGMLPCEIRMMTVDEACTSLRVCRATVVNAINDHDRAIAAGETPPPGSLKSFKWRSRRLIPFNEVLRSLASGDPAAPVAQTKNLPCSRRD